ncbi:unnamed protein product [Miscanthus lutarioriparius]|uniref:Cyclin C-terminal domain-containing protein n=1 Tax=Miscanthus lutarioriparius TaxID=422564 RepID=A0A811PSN8_9POAL|nr:unnamed protein product [Miscanthus lutarioriparius]
MAPSCDDVAASMLLCAEEHSSILCFEEEEEELEAVGRKRGRSPDYGDDFGVDLFPPQSEECVAGLVEKEREHMPRADYGERLRGGGGGGVDLCSPPGGHRLDLEAAKMEETAVPQSLDLQVGDARYVFEAKTIQRMELLVLSTLNWRMQAVTPFSYMDYFLNKLNGGNVAPRSWFFQSAELILCAARGTCCIGFRPSEIAAAVAASVVVGEVNVSGIENACTHVDKERVLRCQEAIQSMASSAIDTVPPKSASGRTSSPVPVPQSPVGVLDAGCLSYKSEDDAAAAATVAASHGASGSSSSSPPVTSKRRKLTSR